MLQVKNETPFVPGLSVLPDLDGVDTLYVSVKATFEIGAQGVRVAEKQLPVVAADEPWGKPGESSVRYAGEVHPLKPATDVVLVGVISIVVTGFFMDRVFVLAEARLLGWRRTFNA